MDKQIYRKDMAECVLCMDPPCSEACSEMDAGRILRSIWFDNERGAALKLTEACVSCNGECEKACIRDVPIRKVMLKLSKVQADRNMILDEKLLESNICGIRIENPFLLSSSVVGSTYDMCARAFDAGWAGVAL